MAAVPRNFKLLDELEAAEKSSKGGADISLGLARPDDTYMSDWQASIFTSAGAGGEPRIFFLTINCGKDYPKVAPTLKFTSRVNMDCVDASGRVVAAKVPYLASWSASKSSMYGALTEIKGLISRASRAQPPDGATY